MHYASSYAYPTIYKITPTAPYLEESPESDRSVSLQAEGEMELGCYKIISRYCCKLSQPLVEYK